MEEAGVARRNQGCPTQMSGGTLIGVEQLARFPPAGLAGQRTSVVAALIRRLGIGAVVHKQLDHVWLLRPATRTHAQSGLSEWWAGEMAAGAMGRGDCRRHRLQGNRGARHLKAAIWRAVRPDKSACFTRVAFLLLTRGASSIPFTVSRSAECTAECSAFHPVLVVRVGSEPRSSSILTRLHCLFSAARWSGVLPLLSW